MQALPSEEVANGSAEDDLELDDEDDPVDEGFVNDNGFVNQWKRRGGLGFAQKKSHFVGGNGDTN